jgi:hypothetical protein
VKESDWRSLSVLTRAEILIKLRILPEDRTRQLKAVQDVILRMGPRKMGELYWNHMALRNKLDVIDSITRRAIMDPAAREDLTGTIEELLGLTPDKTAGDLIARQEEVDKKAWEGLKEFIRKGADLDIEFEMLENTIPFFWLLTGRNAKRLRHICEAVYAEGAQGKAKLRVIEKTDKNFYDSLNALTGGNSQYRDEDAMLKVFEYLMKRDASIQLRASPENELMGMLERKTLEEGPIERFLRRVFTKKDLSIQMNEELLRRSGALTEKSLGDAFDRVSAGMTGEERTSKREWVLDNGKPSAAISDSAVLRKFMDDAGDDVIVFGGAVRNALLNKEKDTEEFDIMIRARLDAGDYRDVAKEIGAILLGDRAPRRAHDTRNSGVLPRHKNTYT